VTVRVVVISSDREGSHSAIRYGVNLLSGKTSRTATTVTAVVVSTVTLEHLAESQT